MAEIPPIGPSDVPATVRPSEPVRKDPEEVKIDSAPQPGSLAKDRIQLSVDVRLTTQLDYELSTLKSLKATLDELATVLKGNSTNVSIGSVVGDVSIDQSVKENDLGSLGAALLNAGISAEDFEALKIAIDADSSEDGDNELGTNVSGWVTSIDERLQSGVLKVATGVTTNVLAAYVRNFLGLD